MKFIFFFFKLFLIIYPYLLYSKPIAILLTENTNPHNFFNSHRIRIVENRNFPFVTAPDAVEDVAYTAFPNSFHPRLSRWWVTNRSDLLSDFVRSSSVEAVDTLPSRWICGSVDKIFPQILHNRIQSLDVTSDPFLSSQWHLDRIYATSAWDITFGNPNVVVGVIDVGVDVDHPDLASQLYFHQAELIGQSNRDDDGNGFIDDLSGWDFVDWDNDPRPINEQEFHGTHVAGILLGARNGLFGVGVAPNVKLLPLRAGEGNSIFAGYQALYYCAMMGVEIVNCSWGGEAVSAIEADAVRFALERGCTIFASAGNDGTNQLFFPASLPGVISVGASNRYDEPAQFSNTSLTVSLWAPGVGIPAPLPNNGWGVLSGTSMASPVAAGVGALVKSMNSQLTSQQIRNILAMSGDPLLRGASHIEQRVNAWRALNEANIVSSTFQNIGWSGQVQGGSILQLTVPIQFQNPFLHPFDLFGSEIIGATWVINQSRMSASQNHTIWTGYLSGRLPSIIRRGHSIQANYLAISDIGYRLYGSSLVRLAPAEVTLNDGQILATFSTIGAMGLVDPYTPLPVGQSVQVPPGSPGVLYHGSFLLAVRNTILDNVWGNDVSSNDWDVPLQSQVFTTGTPPYRVEATAQPSSSGATYNIRVRWIAECVSTTAGVPALDVNGEIQNVSGSHLTNVIAGWLFDFDIIHSSNNVGSIRSNLNLATMGFSNRPERYGIWLRGEAAAGVIRVSPTSSLWQNWGDQRKYELLTWTGYDSDRPQPNDYAILIATQPFNLASNATYQFSIRLFHSPNQSIAEEKVHQWRGGGIIQSRSEPQLSRQPKLYFQNQSLHIESFGMNGTISIYNILGKEILQQHLNGSQNGVIPFQKMPTGVYFIKFQPSQSNSYDLSNQSEFVKKVVFFP